MNGGEALRAYVSELFAPEDDVLSSVRTRQEREGLPGIHISAEEAKIIVVLLHCISARRVLEVGTLGGYSGVWIARALPDGGELVTIECDDVHATVAEAAFDEARLGERVRMLRGDALSTMRSLDPFFDAVFLDADKAPLPEYFAEAVRLVRVGGLLLCDNAFIDGRVVDEHDLDPDVVGVRAYNRLAATDQRLVSAIVPVRDGLAVSVKVHG